MAPVAVSLQGSQCGRRLESCSVPGAAHPSALSALPSDASNAPLSQKLLLHADGEWGLCQGADALLPAGTMWAGPVTRLYAVPGSCSPCPPPCSSSVCPAPCGPSHRTGVKNKADSGGDPWPGLLSQPASCRGPDLSLCRC